MLYAGNILDKVRRGDQASAADPANYPAAGPSIRAAHVNTRAATFDSPNQESEQ